MSRINAHTALALHAISLKVAIPDPREVPMLFQLPGLIIRGEHAHLPAQEGADKGIAPEPVPKGNRVGSLFHFSQFETHG